MSKEVLEVIKEKYQAKRLNSRTSSTKWILGGLVKWKSKKIF